MPHNVPTLVIDEGYENPGNIDYTSESESGLPMYYHSTNSNDIADGDIVPASPPIVDIYMPPAQETDATNQTAKQHEHQSMHVDEIYMSPRQEIAASKQQVKQHESQAMHVDERPKTNINSTISRTQTSTAAAPSNATSKCGSPTMPPPPHFSKCCSAVKPVVHPALPLQSLHAAYN